MTPSSSFSKWLLPFESSGIPKSPQVRFLIVWSSLNHFLVHQPAAMYSIHFQSTHTSYSQYLWSDPHLGSSRKTVVWLFCRSSPYAKAVGCFHRGAASLMFDGVLNGTLSEKKVSTAGVTQGNLELLLSPNSPDLTQTQAKQEKTLDWPHVLISLKENSSTW